MSGCSSASTGSLFEKIPDYKVKYTGVPIPALGICTGDTLLEIEGVLLQKIIDYSTGIGISIPSIDLTTCALFQNEIICCGKTCTDLPCLMQAYLTALCTLYGDVTTLQQEVGDLLNGPYNIACLSGLGSNPKLTAIIQELILEFCALVTTVNNLQTQLNNLSSGLTGQIGDFLRTHISSCQTQLSITGTGASTQLVFKGFVPLGGIIPYGGATAGLFDSTGLGLSNTEMCGWALCNGANGTRDLRELVPVCAGAGVMGGGTLPSVADGSNYPYLALFGETKHLLNSTESSLPTHSHGVDEHGGHGHPFFYTLEGNVNRSGGSSWHMNPLFNLDNTPWYDASTGINMPFVNHAGGPDIQANVGRAKTGITINSAAASASQAHENRQPSIALLYIQRIS